MYYGHNGLLEMVLFFCGGLYFWATRQKKSSERKNSIKKVQASKNPKNEMEMKSSKFYQNGHFERCFASNLSLNRLHAISNSSSHRIGTTFFF
jgi:hypothetical protein